MSKQSPNEKTAYTIVDLVRYKVANAKNIQFKLEKKLKMYIKSPAERLAFLVGSRHQTSRQVLNTLSRDTQIVEVGAGFSPHGLNYSLVFSKYIEIDLYFNSQLKEEFCDEISRDNKIIFIRGNMNHKTTWNKTLSELDPSQPVFIFCEGVISHYSSEAEKDKLATYFKDLLTHKESRLYLDDTLLHHPELDDNEVVAEGKEALSSTLADTSYPEGERRTLAQERAQWALRGFTCVEEVPYDNIPKYAEILSHFEGSIYKVSGN